MKINICVPTRWKPEYLDDFVAETLRHATLAETRVCIAIDDDQVNEYVAKSKILEAQRVLWTTGPREDSLGEKYQRCAKMYDADIYVLATDDLAIKTPRWDLIVGTIASKIPDEIFLLGLGSQWNEPWFPAFQAMSKRWMETQGFLAAPFFPFWWHDTWNMEVAHYCGRYFKIPLEIRYPGENPPGSRRGLAFWAQMFLELLPLRLKTADDLLALSDTPQWRRFQVLDERGLHIKYWSEAQENFQNPAFVSRLEGAMDQSNVNEDDMSRYERLREKIEKLVEQVRKKAA